MEAPPPQPVAAKLCEAGGAAYLVVATTQDVSLYHVDKTAFEQVCNSDNTDTTRPLQHHVKVTFPSGGGLPDAFPDDCISAVRNATKRPGRAIDSAAAFDAPLFSFHDIPAGPRLCVAWAGHNQIFSVGASALPTDSVAPTTVWAHSDAIFGKSGSPRWDNRWDNYWDNHTPLID